MSWPASGGQLTWAAPPGGKGKWELFNLKTDPGETTDVAEGEPDRFKEMLIAWDQYVDQTQVVWGAGHGAVARPNVGDDTSGMEGMEIQDETEDPRGWMSAGKDK